MNLRKVDWQALLILVFTVSVFLFMSFIGSSPSQVQQDTRPLISGMTLFGPGDDCFIITANGDIYRRDLKRNGKSERLGNFWDGQALSYPSTGHPYQPREPGLRN